MDPAAPRTFSPLRTRHTTALTLLAMSTFLAGCVTASSGREAYFSSRANTVMFSPGSGETRVSVGPDTPFANDIALTDASDAAPRAMDADR